MKNVLLVGSSTKCKGGISTVISNILSYDSWEGYQFKHIITHVDGNKLLKFLVYFVGYFRILFNLIFCRVDIVYIHMSMRASFYRKAKIVKLSKLFNKRVIIHHHGSEIFDFYNSLIERRKKYFVDILCRVDNNIVLSLLIQNKFKTISSNIKTFVVYNCVTVPDSNQFNINGKYILFLGRLCQRKGVYDLIEAIKEIDQKIDRRYKFIFCGDGEVDKVKHIIQEKKLEHRCNVLGRINNNEKKKIIFRNTILNVLPSYNEGLPMTILETMSYGIPNISTSISSIPEVIDNGINGFLVKPGDIKNLCKLIESILRDKVAIRNLSNKSYEKIKNNFNLSSQCEKIRTCFDKF